MKMLIPILFLLCSAAFAGNCDETIPKDELNRLLMLNACFKHSSVCRDLNLTRAEAKKIISYECGCSYNGNCPYFRLKPLYCEGKISGFVCTKI